MKKLLCIILLSLAQLSYSQPATEVYLFDLSRDGDSYRLANPVNVSKHEGYDNQPKFRPDGCLYYVSSINGQTDVFHYEDGETTQITATPGGEYSPTPTPDGTHFTAIVLEQSGRQLLWQFQTNGEGAEILIPDLKIGYHAWIDMDKIVSFVLGDTSTLQLSNLTTKENIVLAKNIGRSLHKIPGTKLFSYIQNKPGGRNEIRSFDIVQNSSELLIHTLENSQDVTWAPDGTLFMGQADQLFFWKKGMEDWKSVADLTEFGLKGITRLAISPDQKKIAIVVAEN